MFKKSEKWARCIQPVPVAALRQSPRKSPGKCRHRTGRLALYVTFLKRFRRECRRSHQWSRHGSSPFGAGVGLVPLRCRSMTRVREWHYPGRHYDPELPL